MEREVGEGIGMGNTCKPMADSFQCMTKFTTNKKINKNKNKIKKIKSVRAKGTNGKEKNLSQDSLGLSVSYSSWHPVFCFLLLFEC